MSALSFDNVTIRLGGRDILSAASFDVEEGEFVGMLGANGAGKTTLMRAALGLVPVASGGVAVLGRPATRGNSQIGYVPQNRGAIAGLRLTCWDVVASAAIGGRFGLVRLDKATRREIDWALDEVGARDFARRICERLKVAILFSAHELNPLVNAIDRVLYLGGGEAVIGAVDEVVTGPVLSRLYGAEIEVVRVKNRYYVMAGDVDVEHDAHRHDHAHSHA